MADPKRPSPGKCRTEISARLASTEDKLNRHWRTAFLDALAETSNVTAAAAAAGVHPSRPYKVRRVEPEFARAWRAALLEGYEHLEMELLRRMRFGEGKDEERKFDNATAMRLLAQHRDSVARELAQRENEDVAAIRASIDAKLRKMRENILARRAAESAAHG
ncbi:MULTISPECIES: hypothetical protein [Novosphingobium]|uniref:hypothetical protein n=1 Tax=Novosphingobium TaxID=165696 RepID=UPI001CD1C184|nr:hypothetical protein [Novosphingobium percolationis]MCH7630197.1 hypothetical protein [Pseudomonadota bacterium]